MTKTAASYKQTDLTDQSFDLIIIGSGISGMGVAAIMAKEGKKVLMLERHYTIGGYTHVFKRPGYEWDVGIHYLGMLTDPKRFEHQLWHYITDGTMQWEPMPDCYDKIIIDGKQYNFVAGPEAFTKQMKEYFPDPKDQESIDQYMELLKKAALENRLYYAERMLPAFWSKIFGNMMKKGFRPFAERKTLDVLSEITDNPTLIAVLTGQYGNYGEPPSNSSFGMHCTVVNHYMHGGCFPIGGCRQIADSICQVVTDNGGHVLTNADVTEILVKNNKAIGVKMLDGKSFYAKRIVSSAGTFNTYTRLLPNSLQLKLGVKQKMEGLKRSTSYMCLHIGLADTSKNLGIKKSNYWIYKGTDHDKAVSNYEEDPMNANFPVVYISFPSSKDPTWEERYPGKSTIEIITMAPYELFADWEDKRWRKRGDEYNALKETYSNRLLEELYKVEPQLRGKIDYHELSTPLSTKHFMNYQSGEMYGLSATPDRFAHKFVRVHTPIKNLFLTGQDIICAGVMGALSSAVFTSSILLKRNCQSMIEKRVRKELNITE